MGRPREPIDLIAAKGAKHLTLLEYEQRKNSEVVAPADDIKAPDFLSKKEKERFDILAKELIEIDIMTNLDCHVLGRYIRQENEYEKISKQLAKVKFTIDKRKNIEADIQTEIKIKQYNYLQKMQLKALRACNECARELGLTISSRCKLVVPKKQEDKPKNKFLRDA